MRIFPKRLASGLRGFLRDRRGMAASEFALLLPVMLALLLGTLELSNALIVERKVTAAVQSAADLVAQAREVSTADLNDVFDAVNLILRPYASAAAGTSIYSVVMNGDGSLSVAWSVNRGATAPSATTQLPTGLLQPGTGVVVAAMNYVYRPILGGLVVGTFNLSDRAFLRPRKAAAVQRTL